MAKRTVLVTGAASGIGAGIAERFAAEGYNVAMLDVNRVGLFRLADSMGGGVLPLAGDVCLQSDATQAIDATIARFGSLDVLINNAGIEVIADVRSLAIEDWDRVLSVNLRGAFIMSKFALPVMTAGSSIVNISSVHAFVSYPHYAAYDASKAGLLGLTRSMALDNGTAGIRVNVICPGYIKTPLLDSWLYSLEDPAAKLTQLQQIHPVGRIGTPRDIAEAALFLASESASFISGTSLVVDGGMTLAGH